MRNGAGMIRLLLDRCYPAPPRDVLDRLRALYRSGDPLYTLETEGKVVGMVYCARHSKGGHLESLAVDPEYRGAGLGEKLVEALVADHSGVISLTTRIPGFFKRFGFREVEALPDDSLFMVRIG